MQEQTFHYQSYLLRIWQDDLNGEWHATLQDVFSDECYSFATLTALYANLAELTSEKARQHSGCLHEHVIKPFSIKTE